MLAIRRILVPIDDTPLSAKALDHAITLAERFVAHLYVLNVRGETRPNTIDEVRRDEQWFQHQYDSVVQTGQGALQGHSLPAELVHAEVRTGQPLTCILAAAEELNIDLVVMGTHGRQGLSDLLIGTTTERVLLQAKCALFVVREDPT